jgi:predicted RNase H-like nuclease (RuvC/YqgF family)
MSEEETQVSIEMAKELLEEVKILKQRIENLEAENDMLTKRAEDPTKMMKEQGWQTFVTPHADETFDPLNRDISDSDSFKGPFSGSGEMIVKSRYEELAEWEDAEREMRP